MRNFFGSVKKNGQHIANLAVQHYRDEEKEEMDNEKRQELRAELAERCNERRNQNRTRRIEAARSSRDERSDEQKVQDDIDSVMEDIPVVPTMPKNGVKRHKRPPRCIRNEGMYKKIFR